MIDAVDHIARSILPWRQHESQLTECGLRAVSFPTITRPAYFERLKELGKTRTAMLTCVTCADTTRRWRTWDDDPVDAMKRETEKYWGGGHPPGPAAPHNVVTSYERWEAFRRELRAIAALIAEHREEFEAHISVPGNAVDLDKARAARRERLKRPRADGWPRKW